MQLTDATNRSRMKTKVQRSSFDCPNSVRSEPLRSPTFRSVESNRVAIAARQTLDIDEHSFLLRVPGMGPRWGRVQGSLVTGDKFAPILTWCRL